MCINCYIFLFEKKKNINFSLTLYGAFIYGRKRLIPCCALYTTAIESKYKSYIYQNGTDEFLYGLVEEYTYCSPFNFVLWSIMSYCF